MKQQPADPLAIELRFQYVNAYRQRVFLRTGARSDYGARSLPRWDGAFWLQLAAHCREHQLTPAGLIEAVFAEWRENSPPAPSVLKSEYAIQCYNAREIRREADVRRASKIQQQQLAVEVGLVQSTHPELTELAAVRRALTSPRLDLSAFFRYVAATCAGLEDMATQHLDAAAAQYQESRAAYDAVWKELIPAELKAAADAAKEAL